MDMSSHSMSKRYFDIFLNFLFYLFFISLAKRNAMQHWSPINAISMKRCPVFERPVTTHNLRPLNEYALHTKANTNKRIKRHEVIYLYTFIWIGNTNILKNAFLSNGDHLKRSVWWSSIDRRCNKCTHKFLFTIVVATVPLYN